MSRDEARAYFEDIEIARVRDHVEGRVVTAEEIERFANECDPTPFHMNEAAAKASVLGSLCATASRRATRA